MISMTALNPNTYNYLLENLKPCVEGLENITEVTSLSGGDINEAFRLSTNVYPLFLKRNSAKRFPAMFEKEARGLKLLSGPDVIRIPEVIWYGETGDDAFLVLKFIEEGRRDAGFAEKLGNKLAALHAVSSDHFGLDHDNYIGSLPQSNRKHTNWSDFMVNERLEPQFEKAYNDGHFHVSARRAMERLFEKLDHIFPREKPSLVHGDLWGRICGTSSSEHEKIHLR